MHANRWSGDVVVILTALDLEYRAVRDRLAGLEQHEHGAGTLFELGTLRGARTRVALAHVGMGNHGSAVLAERAIAEFNPAAVLFVGVAGGLNAKAALGDVVVATHVYAYHGAAVRKDRTGSRPRVWELSHRIDQIAHHVARAGRWVDDLPEDRPRPEVRFGGVASGEILHDAPVSSPLGWIQEHYEDALAIEMEAAGVAKAGHLNAGPIAVVRGISDLADGTKSASDGESWQRRAAENAAAFAAALAAEIKPTSVPVTPQERFVTENHNHASGDARVGVQGGTITGDVTFGAGFWGDGTPGRR